MRDPYFYLSIVVRLLVFYLKWLVQSFFFGYFFEYLRGENGFKKGLWLAVFVLVCSLSLDILQLTSIAEIPSLFFEAAQKTTFFAALGTIAFDYMTLRKNGFGWRKLRLISDVPGLTTLVSLIVSAASVAVTAVLTGRVTDLVTVLLSLAIPEIPQLP